MSKVVQVQALCRLSDDGVEFQIRDRRSFIRFLDFGLGDHVPDAKIIWLFSWQLLRAGAMKTLFEQNATIRSGGTPSG